MKYLLAPFAGAGFLAYTVWALVAPIAHHLTSALGH